jgi:hypothetical protein
LKRTPISPPSTFTSIDITNMYSNIPAIETKRILEDVIMHNLIDPQF